MSYTQIPNEILEALSGLGLNGTQLSIVLIVLRQTYGYHEESKKISITFLMNGTGKSRPTITSATRQLVKKTILVKKTLLGRTSTLSISPKIGQYISTSKESDTSKENDTQLVKKPLPNKERKKYIYKTRKTKLTPETETIFSSYKEKINTNSRLLEKGREKITTRLKVWSPADLLKAISNFSKDTWWMDNNAHRGIAWFFNSDERIEQFINLKPRQKQKETYRPVEEVL